MFQSIVNVKQTSGIAGDFADNSPRRCSAYVLNKNGNQLPTLGRAFTFKDATNDPMQVTIGNAGTAQAPATFAGILVNTKELVRSALTASLEVADYSEGTLCTMGHIWVKVATAVTVGAQAYFDPATGEIGDSTLTDGIAISGAKFVLCNALSNEMAVVELA